MSHATLHPRVQIQNYNSRIGTGSTARINNQGMRWNYESKIDLYTRMENTALTIGTNNNNVTNFKHTTPTSITITSRFYFVENIGQPYAQTFIYGRFDGIPDEKEISITNYIFLKSNQFERYIDMLRNEDPVYLWFSCDIDEDQSNYLIEGTNIDLLPIEQIDIRGFSTVNLSTSGEDVGDGED